MGRFSSYNAGMSADIAKTYWFDGERIGTYDPASSSKLFKWVLFRREGKLFLAAMPRDAGFDFHMQLLAEVALRNGWCDSGDADKFLRRYDEDFIEAGIATLGGGARLSNGTVRNYSYRFGAIPEKYRAAVESALGLK